MTDENQIKVLFCILRRRFVDYVPEFENCVEEREVINETPKGYRMSVSYGTSVYLHADYEFFESRQAAYYLTLVFMYLELNSTFLFLEFKLFIVIERYPFNVQQAC